MNSECNQDSFKYSYARRDVAPEQARKILDIDYKFLQETLVSQTLSKGKSGGWVGKCPFCSTNRSKSRLKEKTHLPAYLFPGNIQGFIFHCYACETTLTTYKFLKQVQGDDAAERYAQERWDAGQLCGQGWNCPLPSKEYRKESYLHAALKRKQENYQNKHHAKLYDNNN
jgi:hypothetical protein